MLEQLLHISTAVTGIGSAVVAGVMFAFATSIMPGLAKLPVPQAIQSMQAFNKAILNPVFLLLFTGTAVAAVVLVVTALWDGGPRAWWLVAGAALYLFGAFGVTVVVNVPLNEAVDAAEPHGEAAAKLWSRYLRRWVPWNRLRAVAGVAAAVTLLLASW